MTRNILSLVTAAAIAGAFVAPSAQAQFSVSDFKTDIAKAVGTKKGLSAVKAAAKTLGKYAKGDSKKVVTFTKLALKQLKKAKVAVDDKGATSLTDKMANGYFTKVKYNPNDAKFKNSLSKIVASVKKPTPTQLNNILKPLDKLNSKKGGTSADLQSLTDTVYKAGKQTPPMPS